MSADITDVTGGAGGIEAVHDAIRALAATFDDAGSALRGWSTLGARTMADPALLASAPLSPLTFAEAEATVLAATTGPDGLLVESCAWEADAVLVRAALTALEVADAAAQAHLDQVDRTLARTPLVALAVVPGMPDVVVENLLNGLQPGLTAGLLAAAYGGAGTAAVTRIGRQPSAQPADLEGLVTHLQGVAALSPEAGSPLNGTIEIQTIDGGDGPRHIVYLPGTDDMATLPWTQDGDVRDLPTDFQLMAGREDPYQQGILDAMAQAGVAAHEPVLLVGHSMGGMAAAAILGRGSEFDVTHVVTAGSPTAQVPSFPDGSHVLSLEHQGDVVPLTDGAPNPDTVEQVTVRFEAESGPGIVDRHAYAPYVEGAAAADASTDPSVREQLESLHADGFLAGPGRAPATVTSQVFQVVRAP
ncbi:hypothetical protein [Nocardioides sp. SR21]|uniref:PGAP1-like alpha/beta domain-containing protein n=1 Tax=Nocardioides sp. SR21 TaxID=2919501 RepID=UPI001FA982F3|nr:hypothetical protein [Nocardioides sp. SR21]